MDPNATLTQIRDLICEERHGEDVDASTSLDRLDSIMDLFESLDGWMSARVFLPDDWRWQL